MKNKIKFDIAFLSLVLIFALSSVNVNAANSCSGCSTYTYIEQSTINGVIGYCINPNVKGSLKTATATMNPTELSGGILDWAQNYTTARKQQIAYRLIALENGLTSINETTENKCIYNGCYTNDAEFNEVYNSWKQQSNKKINRSSSSMYITGNVTKSNGKFTANLMVTGPSGQVINLSVNGGTNVNISKTTLNGSGNVVVTGDLLPECSDGDDNVTVIATTKTASSSTSTGTKIPGTPGTTDSSLKWLYYPSINGTQGFIVPARKEQVEEIISTPGKKPGYIPGKTDSNSSSDSATYEINIEPSDCEKNCDVQYSGDFKCDGSGSQTEYINETNNIISCITSGKYRNNCGGTSIQKTTDVDSKVNLSNSNPYCRVYCKEDISFNLPGEVKVKNGSYFTLSEPFTSTKDISIEGKRSCYVGAPKNSKSNGIDKDQYVKDIKAKQNEIIAKYNEYLKKKAEYEAYVDARNSTAKESTCSGTCNKKNVVGASVYYHENTNDHVYAIYSANYDENGSATLNQTPNGGKATSKYGEEYTGATGCNGNTPICAAPTKIDDPNLEAKYYTSILDQVSTLNDQLNEIVKNYKSCFDWTNNYCSFDPKLTFSYEEVYNSQVSGELVQKGEIKIGQTKDGEYYTKVDSEYNGKNKGKSETPQNYIKLVGTGIKAVVENVDMTNTYVKKVTTSTKSFEGYTNKVVCSYHPVGTIVVGDNCNKDGNYIKLNGNGYVFPVALEHKETRQYNYNLEVSNIGAPGDDSSCTTTGLNRVVGDSCSKYEQASSKLEAKYTCQYSSCPECEVECVCPKDSQNCYVEDKICKYCDDCVVICVGCTWNDGDLAFGYKQVSLNDVFPNTERTETGYNWNTNSSVNPKAEKANATLNEIEEHGQEVYKTAQYSYTLSPKVMSDIREYNAKANRETSIDNIPVGGYSNDTLKCSNGVHCTSSFLDWIKDNTKAENKRNSDWKEYEDGSSWK